MDKKQSWTENLNEEICYWTQMYQGTFHNKNWVESFKKRVKGIDICPKHIIKYIKNANNILDVGCGPATVIGGILDGKELSICAVDACANEYNELYKKYSVSPPLVRPIYGEFENLPEIINKQFDFIYSRNALDHSYNPLLGIHNMLAVCEQKGIVYFECIINNGINEKYKGLHLWNFMPVSGDIVIWNRDNTAQLLSKELQKDISSIEVSRYDKWVRCKIQKR